MKKLFVFMFIVCLVSGCSNKGETYDAVPENNNVNSQLAGNVLIENKSFTIDENSTELILNFTNKNDKEVSIKKLKINFKDTTGKIVYTKDVSIDKDIKADGSYEMSVVCDKPLIEVSDFEYKLTVK